MYKSKEFLITSVHFICQNDKNLSLLKPHIAFHIALKPLGKVWIQLFSLQLWVGQTGFFSLGEATSLGEGKLWIQSS